MRDTVHPGLAGPAVVLASRLALALIVVAACGPALTVSPPPPTAVPTGTPPVASPPPTSPPVTFAPTSPPPSMPSASGGISAVVQDGALLDVLPVDVSGIPVQLESEAFAEAVSDPAFVANVEAAAFAVVFDAGDLASGLVARPRPGVYSDAFFRDWRDTYDQGACAQAGGVAGNAEAELGGRLTHITSCAGGLLVYHAYLEDLGVIVSLISIGERRFGEQLMEGLRP